MKVMRSIRRSVSRWRLLAATMALAAMPGLVALATAQMSQTAQPAPMQLDQDLAKLAVVVMANQTPITQADARALLPVLERVQAQREEARGEGGPPDDDALAALDSELRAGLSPGLQSALGVVRLLAPVAPPGPGFGPGGMDAPEAGDGQPPGPPPGGRGRGPRGGGGPSGMTGPWLLNALVDFFRSAAGG